MATLTVYAGSLERLEALLFGADPAKARYGGPERLLEHLLNEDVLARARAGLADFDAEAAEAALGTLVSGPRPDGPLDRRHALVFQGLVERLCTKIGDEAFGPTTQADLAAFGKEYRPALGEEILESLTSRRLPFVGFSDEVQSPWFSYWMQAEMKGFLKKLPAALKSAHHDPAADLRLHRLHGAWQDAVGQGPDAILVGTI